MASRKASDQVREWLNARAITRVTEAVFAELAQAFPNRKERALRQAVRGSELPLDPIVEGVRQDSLPELARTLITLQHEYQAGDQRRIRALVLESKAHARFAVRKRPEKREMVEWMLVWLHDPSLFETWVRLRLRSLDESDSRNVAGPDTHETDEH